MYLHCLACVTKHLVGEKEFIVYELLMSINVICCQYFSGSKMGGSDNDIIFVSALLARF